MAEHLPSEDRLRELLAGKKIVNAHMADEPPDPSSYTSGPTGYLTLSDGLVLKVWGHDGGCACSSGCYPLAVLNDCDNIITNVEVEERPDEDYGPCRTCGERNCYEDDHDNAGYYRIFVFAEDKRINIASFEGSDGGGYYGTGFWIDVVAPMPTPVTDTIEE